MRKIILPAAVAVLAGSLSLAPMAQAEDLGKVVSGVATALLNQEVDKAAYLEAQRANTIPAYRDYLAKFPKGIYVGNAQQQLAKLGARPAPTTSSTPAVAPAANASAAQVESNLGLTRSQRVTVQRNLTKLGYDTRGADGLWGRGTRGAIASWQKANKMTATGYVTGPQIERIADQAAAVRAPAAQTPATAGGDAALEERLLGLSVSERREIQLRLTLLGYDTNGTDGVFGANTRRALARWQGDHGETATGYVTADQVRELQSESRG